MEADPKKDRSLTGKLGAIRMAEIIGCSGAHQDASGKWNPCATPEELDKISNAAEPPKRKTALSEIEDWQKSRSLKGKKKKIKKEWSNLRERGVYGLESTADGGIVTSTSPSGVGSGIKSISEEKGVNPFSPRDNDVDVFTDIESARARSRQLGCIGVSRRISKSGRTVWMPCTNMSDYSRLSGTTALGRRHQNEALTRRIRTVLRDDLTKLKRKKSLFFEIHGFNSSLKDAISPGTSATGVDIMGKKKKGTRRGPKNDQNSIREAMNDAVHGRYKSDEFADEAQPMSENQAFLASSKPYRQLPEFENPCGDGYVLVGRRRNRHGKFVNNCIKVGTKSIGRGIGRFSSEPFDPNAVDGDNDGLVQEGTPFERPATPKTPDAVDAVVPKPSEPKVPTAQEIEEATKRADRNIKRRTHMDWANANPGFRAVQGFVQKYKRDPKSMTDADWDKLEKYYKQYGPGGTRRGARSARYIGPPNVGGRKMGEIILGRVKKEHRGKKEGERTHFAVAGAPGMGKSTLVDFLQKNRLVPKDDEAAHIDPDFVKQGLSGYAGGRGAGQVHIESATSARRISEDAAREGMDIITEGTGQRGGYYNDINKNGYRTVGHWAFTSPSTAVSRLKEREKADGRRIDENITDMVHTGTYGLVTGYLKNGTLNEFHLWDTDVEKGKDPKKIAEVVDGVLKVHDKDKFIAWADGGLGRSGATNLSYWQKRFAKKQ